jgi:hypothetical protein
MKFVSLAKSLSVIAVISLGTPGSAVALTLSNAPSGESIGDFGVPDSQTYGQVFTAPITGTLTSFTLSLNGGVGELFGGVAAWNGTPGFGLGFGTSGAHYQSATVPSLAAGPYTFTPNFPVVAGNLYVAYLSVFGVAGADAFTTMPLAFDTPNINYFVWNNSNVSGVGPTSSSWNYEFNIADSFNGGDALFSATFSESVVPVPAALPLFLTGLGLIGLLARRKRKQAMA